MTIKPKLSFSWLALILLLVAGFQVPREAEPQQLNLVDWAALSQAVRQRIEGFSENIKEIRRGYQRYPELPDNPVRTRNLVGKTFEVWGLRVAGVNTSLVGHLQGGLPGPGVALRLEMDAVRINDPIDPPRMRIPVKGVRHLLGNDLQLTMISALGHIWAPLRESIPGSIRVIAQSGSSLLKGAAPLVERGALQDDPEIEIVIGMKAAPLEAGQVGISVGQATAAADRFEIELRRNLTRADFAARLTEIIRKLEKAPPGDQADYFAGPARAEGSIDGLVTFSWRDESEETLNPHFRGQFRAASREQLAEIRNRLREELEPLSDSLILRFPIDPVEPVQNDPELARTAIGYLKDILGADNVVELKTPNPFVGDDFSEFQKETRVLLLWIGVASPDKKIRGIPGEADFDIDDAALQAALSALSQLPLRYMAERVNEVVRSGGQER